MPPSTPASNRGFWIVLGAFLVVGAIVIVGAIVSRQEPASEQGAAENLALAADAARIIRTEQGSWADADPAELGVVELRLRFVGPDQPSTDARTVSVFADDDRWIGVALDPVAEAPGPGCLVVTLRDGGPTDPVSGPCTADAVLATGGAGAIPGS